MAARDSFFPLKHPLSLRYFHEVARAGSFRKASEQVHIAASALNRHVKYLEEEMGTLLFERGKGRAGLKLTAAGEVLLYRLKRAIAELGTARTEVNSLLGLDQGTVKMGVNEGIWRELLPSVLTAFRKAHPGIVHHAVVGGSPRLVELLLADEIDLALAFNPRPHPDLTFAVRHHVQACVMVRRTHPLARLRTVRLSDCAGHDLVMPDESLALRATLDGMFAQADVSPRTVLSTNSYEVMRSAAEAGVGIAILTQQLFHPQGARSPVVFVPLRDAGIPAQVIACCVRKGRPLSAAARAMVGAIEQGLAQAARPAAPRG
ncbi:MULTISPECIES: LysR family transcriptional regulator [Ramlibacter]|uniref:LysR family transcriptional regulator n=1 Tax=Ramlibacter pinisoli TaxID=2682844 RepID=A0A6N8IT42_9BURK|nr:MULTISPECIES: LysR family transcriptional regulator [Ramlibacter]MBA2964077.1 LysR family transcriptional regulator [Ramlibacter sp. CGMCC 1.13660]MVQ29043.1 LysR family transcriptional regulator [Ramlibacter pinisoli]